MSIRKKTEQGNKKLSGKEFAEQKKGMLYDVKCIQFYYTRPYSKDVFYG